MIIGIGNDLCNISRIEKIISTNLNGLIRRLFSDKELFCFESKKFSNTTQKAAYIAKRFAAKEACAKAIGTGFAEGILWKDIQLISNRLGKPELIVSGQSLHSLQKISGYTNFNFHVSLSDDYPWAQAFVVIETS